MTSFDLGELCFPGWHGKLEIIPHYGITVLLCVCMLNIVIVSDS